MKQNYRKLFVSGALLLGIGVGSAALPSVPVFHALISQAQAQEKETMEALFSPETTPEGFAAAQAKAKSEKRRRIRAASAGSERHPNILQPGYPNAHYPFEAAARDRCKSES